MKSINPPIFLIATLLNLLVIKVAAYLLPGRVYFSFSSFLFDDRSILKLQAVALKLALPFVTAFALAAIVRWARSTRVQLFKEASALDHTIQEQLEVTLMSAAFLSALLMAWPYILLWDLLIDPQIATQRLLFLIAYLIYFTGYAYFARAGVEAAAMILSRDCEHGPITLSTFVEHPVVKPIVTTIGGAIASAVAAFLVTGSQ